MGGGALSLADLMRRRAARHRGVLDLGWIPDAWSAWLKSEFVHAMTGFDAKPAIINRIDREEQ